jgi:hypothetical protein|nr:MAG TPA: hypothetical protein [Bacteriophage sp.]DAW45128.1 MAG TPA: hypothetical protein [Bacteriophage sp.]
MKVFVYNNASGELELNEPEILLVREFEGLWEKGRNKCKEDPTGTRRLRAFREFKYIFLMLDWLSPYSQFDEQERHQECLQDASITDEEWADPTFRAACRKYRELQESSKTLKFIKAAQGVVDKITDYFNDLDLSERDPVTQKPIYKTKDVIAEMQNASKVVDELKNLEVMYKKEIQAVNSSIRGDAELGAFD